MKEKFKYSLDNKRYHTYNYHVKERYKQKVFKVSLNTNLSCPNKDGSKGYGGCIFCKEGSSEFAGNINEHLMLQYDNIKERMHLKWPTAKYVAYFQANTNTHAPLAMLEQFFRPFSKIDDVVQISIGTRPDCLSDDVIALLEDINKDKPVIVEIGLQTIHATTANTINRCFELWEFEQAVDKLNKAGIEICVHLINGLPGESQEMMIETVKKVATYPIQAVKLHSLFVLKDTVIAQMLANNEFQLLERQAYIDTIIMQLRHLPEHIVIQRLTGDGYIKDLIGPLWATRKVTVLNDIDKQMKELDVYQGDLYE